MAIKNVPSWFRFYFTKWVSFASKLDNKMIAEDIMEICHDDFQIGESVRKNQKKIMKKLVKTVKKREKIDPNLITKNDQKLARILIEMMGEFCDSAIEYVNKRSDSGKLGAQLRWGKNIAPPMAPPLAPPSNLPIANGMHKEINKGCHQNGPLNRPGFDGTHKKEKEKNAVSSLASLLRPGRSGIKKRKDLIENFFYLWGKAFNNRDYLPSITEEQKQLIIDLYQEVVIDPSGLDQLIKEKRPSYSKIEDWENFAIVELETKRLPF